MIQGEVSETSDECGHLKSGKRFHSNKRRRTVTRRQSFSATRRGDYELVPYIDKDSCYKEE